MWGEEMLMVILSWRMRYSSGKWTTLKAYSARGFAMTAIDNHLILVGGMGRNGVSKVLGVWSEDSKNWTNPYPDMTTEHYR